MYLDRLACLPSHFPDRSDAHPVSGKTQNRSLTRLVPRYNWMVSLDLLGRQSYFFGKQTSNRMSFLVYFDKLSVNGSWRLSPNPTPWKSPIEATLEDVLFQALRWFFKPRGLTQRLEDGSLQRLAESGIPMAFSGYVKQDAKADMESLAKAGIFARNLRKNPWGVTLGRVEQAIAGIPLGKFTNSWSTWVYDYQHLSLGEEQGSRAQGAKFIGR
jgi:hypothetical protein